MDYRGVVAVFIVVASSFVLGRCTSKPTTQVIEHTKYDTIRVISPEPVSSVMTSRIVRLPIFLFAPRDTVIVTKTLVDSIDVEVPFERREYSDSTLYAVVSGPSLGDARPTLEEYRVVSREMTIQEPPRVPFLSPYISGMLGTDGRMAGFGAGVFIKGNHGIGLDYIHSEGIGKVGVRYTYKF